MPPVALIDRVEAAIAGIAHTQTPPANPTEQQALQQTKALTGWPREDFAIGPVPRQALAVGEELIPGDISWMVPRNDDAPLILWHEAGLSADLAGWPNLLASLVSPEHGSSALLQGAAFAQGLKDTGFIESNNISIEWRWAEGQYNRLPSLAGELVSRGVAVIVAFDAPAASAAKAATKTIPIVFVTGADPVKTGLVDSINRPGGNLTGLTTAATMLGPK